MKQLERKIEEIQKKNTLSQKIVNELEKSGNLIKIINKQQH